MTKSIHHTERTHIRQRGGWESQATGKRARQREGGAGREHGRGASSRRAHRQGSAWPLEGGCWRRWTSTTTAGPNRTRPLWPPPSYFRGLTIHLLRNEPRGSRARSTRASQATGRVPGVRAARAPSKPSTPHDHTGLGAHQPQPRGCPWSELGGLHLVNRLSPHGPLYRTCFHYQRTKGMTACSSLVTSLVEILSQRFWPNPFQYKDFKITTEVIQYL